MTNNISLVLYSYESFCKVFDPIFINDEDLKTLQDEVDEYNNHIELLLSGKAPDDSYSDLQNKFILNEIDEKRGHKDGKALYPRSYYGDGSRAAYFLIMCHRDDDCIMCHRDDDDYEHEYHSFDYSNIDVMSKDEAVSMFTLSFGNDEFQIGYKILPMTFEILNHQRIKMS
jgi:hypothetical protein